MTGAQLLTDVLSYTDNVSATDADNAKRRARVLSYLQQTVEFVWNYRPWRFLYKRGTFTISSDGTGILPSDFGQFGWKGRLYTSTGERMDEEVDAADLVGRFLRGERNTTDYSLLDYDSSTSKPKIQTLQVSGTLTALYCRHVPTVADSSAVLPIPLDYHNTVLLPGTIVKARKSKGDVRDFQSEFLVGLDLMCKKEAPMQGTAQDFPLVRQGW